MAVVGSGRCIGMIDLMITQLSCWLDPSIWLLYILYAAVALSSLIHLAELSCQPEGHGHLAASCLSTYLHAHTRTERVMVLIEERPSLPPNRACLRCNRTHTRTCKISACCVCIASTFLASTSSCTLLAAVEGGPAAPAASADPPPSRSLVPSISTPAPVNICVTHLRDTFVQKSAKLRQS